MPIMRYGLMKRTNKLTTFVTALTLLMITLLLLVMAVGSFGNFCVSSDLSRWPTASVQLGECEPVPQIATTPRSY